MLEKCEFGGEGYWGLVSMGFTIGDMRVEDRKGCVWAKCIAVYIYLLGYGM